MKFHTIITCVNFTDYLEFVYQYNKAIINNISIISSTTDEYTKKFCIQNNIFLYQTDSFFKNNNPFNKAASINDFLLNNYTRLEEDDWILLTDADIIFTDPIIEIDKLIDNSLISEEHIVSCPRKIFHNHINYPNGSYNIENIGFFGYFQFFNKHIIMPEILNGKSPIPENIDASIYDIKFIDKYWNHKDHKKLYLSNYYAIHCGFTGTHWKGRNK